MANPDFPMDPMPNELSPMRVLNILDVHGDVLRFARKRFTRERREQQLFYIFNDDDYYKLLNNIQFRAGMGGRLLKYTEPVFHKVEEVFNETPIRIKMKTNHVHNTGDSVLTVGIPGVTDGEYVITRLLRDEFTLDGTTASGGSTNTGTFQLILPSVLVVYDRELSYPGNINARPYDEQGIFTYAVTIREF